MVHFENPLPLEGQGLLSIAPVSSGLDEWEVWLQEGSIVKGTNEVKLIDDSMFIKVARFQRSSHPDDGGSAGLFYKIDIDAEQFSS